MVLRTMKNCHSPTTHLAAALLGAAMATTLLTNEPLGRAVADAANGEQYILDHVAHHDDQLPLVSVPDATTAAQLGSEARSTNR